MFLWITLEHFDGSLSTALLGLWAEGPASFAIRFAPRMSFKACIGYLIWLVFQANLYTFLPGRNNSGRLTPAGNLLKYTTNGLIALGVTHLLIVMAAIAGILNPAILAHQWEGLFIAANIYGSLLSILSYVKAHIAPTYPEDRKFSGQDIPKFIEYRHSLTGHRIFAI